jgi:hypothetical protein
VSAQGYELRGSIAQQVAKGQRSLQRPADPTLIPADPTLIPADPTVTPLISDGLGRPATGCGGQH